MGIAASSKEERRNLRREIGDKAAAAVTELRGVVDQALMQHKVLAKQMFAFETGAAAHAEAMAHLRKQLAEHGEVLENLKTRIAAVQTQINDERTFRISLSQQQRVYVDNENRLLRERIQRLERSWWRRWLRVGL
jgi:chromosome segregation ATPase